MSSFFLPRFGLGSTSNSNTNETAISFVKQIGDRHGEENRNFNPRQLDEDLKSLIALMKRHRRDKHVQRVACHTISNMAIHQEKCPVICRFNGHRAIVRAVVFFLDDWKMCWLGMSALVSYHTFSISFSAFWHSSTSSLLIDCFLVESGKTRSLSIEVRSRPDTQTDLQSDPQTQCRPLGG